MAQARGQGAVLRVVKSQKTWAGQDFRDHLLHFPDWLKSPYNITNKGHPNFLWSPLAESSPLWLQFVTKIRSSLPHSNCSHHQFHSFICSFISSANMYGSPACARHWSTISEMLQWASYTSSCLHRTLNPVEAQRANRCSRSSAAIGAQGPLGAHRSLNIFTCYALAWGCGSAKAFCRRNI